MFSLICAWINGSANNREAGDLRRHRGHHDVNVMMPKRNGRHFTHDILKRIFGNKTYRFLPQISLKFVHIGLGNPLFSGGLPHKWRALRIVAWWRHQMGTSSAILVRYAGNSPVTGEFPSQRPVKRSFDVLFDLRLNKRWSTRWRLVIWDAIALIMTSS